MKDRRITLRDIAETLGISVASVSLGMRNDPQIPESTRRKIHSTAQRLGYRPDPVVSKLMIQLRNRRPAEYRAKLALFNGNEDRRAFQTHPTIPKYLEGCRNRAESRGYSFDEFWLHDPAWNARSLLRILRTRNIQGIVIVGLMKTNRLPLRLRPLWENFPTAVTGVRTRNPTLSFTSVDHFNLASHAMKQAVKLGYRKPALVLDREIDHLVDGRFSAGAQKAVEGLPKKRQVPFFLYKESEKDVEEKFHRWRARHQPDCLLILYNKVRHWLENAGLKIPEDLGLIQLEWRATDPFVAGMNQHNEIVGANAVDLVINQIHANTVGIPEHPTATMVGADWVSGPSVGVENYRS